MTVTGEGGDVAGASDVPGARDGPGARDVPGDVQAVEIQGNPAMAAEPRAVSRTVSVYYVRDGAARVVTLPHLNNRTHTEFDAEVEQLRALWTRLRGPGWQRSPQATARLEKTERSLGRSATGCSTHGAGPGAGGPERPGRGRLRRRGRRAHRCTPLAGEPRPGRRPPRSSLLKGLRALRAPTGPARSSAP